MPFELLPHPSDMGVRGIGETPEEAFAEAARAMFSLMADLESIEPKEAIPLKVEADSLESLFVSFFGGAPFSCGMFTGCFSAGLSFVSKKKGKGFALRA